jgi:endonuclease/exonuclease/phosphatase family metal-dependent hydrolase
LKKARDLAAANSEERTSAYLEQFVARAQNQITGDADDVRIREELVTAARSVITLLAAGEQAPNERPYTLLQMNLCLSGLAGCYGRTQYPKVVDEAVERIRTEAPQAVTFNESCSGDIERIADETGYAMRFATVIYNNAPLPCSRPGGRGVFGNAVRVQSGITSSEDAAFQAQLGSEERRWTCVNTVDKVSVCVSHFSVAGTPAQATTNQAQCDELTQVLARIGRTRATIFAGDVNRQGSCAPEDFWTLRDSEASQARGIQHVYGSAQWFPGAVAEVVPMVYTDHDALISRAVLRQG